MCTKIALVGSPNTAKTSLFNLLTGMNQQVGNFPGVTVEKHWGKFNLPDGRVAELLDLPGAYSLNAYSEEEKIVSEILHNKQHADFPELVVVTVDVTNLERNLVILTQISDLDIPVIGVLTMNDMLIGKSVVPQELTNAFNQIPFLKINGRTGEGKQELIDFISACNIQPVEKFISFPLKENLNIAEARRDAESRKTSIVNRLKEVPSFVGVTRHSFTTKVDKLLVHPILGYAFFGVVLFLIFQFMFSISAIPMDWIDSVFLNFSQYLQTIMPEGTFTDLITQGIVPGVGGVLIFVPQIAILFFFLGVLEETGYMTRVVFIMDRLVRPFGLNGRSIVPLVSSAACAIPAILSTRVIGNPKERLITILVSPLISCSARIPVFVLLIYLVIPNTYMYGFIGLQGTVLFAMYALGVIGALLVAMVMNKFIRSKEKSFLLLELPEYRWPRWKNILLHLKEKVQAFVFDAGKIILAISIVLWAFAAFPKINEEQVAQGKTQIEESYLGQAGKTIAPVFAPLGYDWKMTVSLLTSFAAREVFVGTMATLYSAGENFEEDESLLQRMREDINLQTGKPAYSLASGLSLMVFYVFAMQCMATFAAVKRETKSWKWPLIQMGYMGFMAYTLALLTFNIFS
jgi:ferrous iron transport protein B